MLPGNHPGDERAMNSICLSPLCSARASGRHDPRGAGHLNTSVAPHALVGCGFAAAPAPTWHSEVESGPRTWVLDVRNGVPGAPPSARQAEALPGRGPPKAVLRSQLAHRLHRAL
jgi:hypothetical protein